MFLIFLLTKNNAPLFIKIFKLNDSFMKKLILIIFLLIGIFVQAQIITTKVKAGTSIEQSNELVYALPEAKLRVDVWVEKTDFLKGPYSTYANKLLGISDIIEYDYSNYHIKNIKISTEYTPDPQQLYSMSLGELSGRSEISKFISMNKSGLFGGIIYQASEETTTNGKVFEKIVKGNRNFNYYADANLVQKVDTIIRRVDIDTATIEKATLKRYSVEKDIATRAQDAATYLMDIRKSRFELISGYNEVAYNEGAIQMMNAELKKMEDDYLALFAGKQLISDQHYVFYFTPDGSQPNIIAPIFRFSKESGLGYLTSSGGEKVSIAIKSNGLAEHLNDIPTTTPVSGVIYRIPETAEVWVKYGANEYDKQLMIIPQLGKLQSIQINQNSFELHPSTGGIKLLEIRE